MFSKVLTSALIAGFGAGLIAATLQLSFLQPILLFAELYEAGVLQHFATTPAAVVPPGYVFDLYRDVLTVVFTALIYVGYALVLLPAMAFAQSRGAAITPRTGLIWGIGGFAAVQLAPAFGLPPELPGIAGADVDLRQIWWGATVIATAMGLWLIAFGQNWALWGTAIILIAAPQIIGAPQPDAFTGPAPPELGAEFASRALGVGFAAWASLGLFTATIWGADD